MAAILLLVLKLMLMLSIISSSSISGVVAQPQARSSNITLGSSLKPTGPQAAWLSPSGLYAFGFYEQAKGMYRVGVFVAGIPQKPVVWTANRDDPPLPPSATLLLTTDGRLVLQSPQRREVYITDTSERIASASMLDTGNFVVYNSDQGIMWQSFDHPTTTIVEGQRLSAGMELFSSISETDQSTGIFRLKMQGDGNLVQYPVQTPDGSYPYWSSVTFTAGNNVSLNLDDDGHLYLLNSSGINIKDIYEGGHDTNGTIYLMRIDSDGICRLYSYTYKLNQNINNNNGNPSVIWVSTDDKCAPLGLCGLNGYCVNEDRDAVCRCLPGFAAVIDGNFSAGCEKDFSSDSCKTDGRKIQYTIQAVDNTVWEDDGYSVLSLLTKDDCASACLQDCVCEAAMFKDGRCRKQKLPLRFGRRSLDNSNVALIKVGIPSSLLYNNTKKGERESNVEILIIGLSLIGFAIICWSFRGFCFIQGMLTHTRGSLLMAT